jgi:hypothetical protein
MFNHYGQFPENVSAANVFTVQEHFIAYCTCREAIKLFRFQLSPYIWGRGVGVAVSESLETRASNYGYSDSVYQKFVSRHSCQDKEQVSVRNKRGA